MSDQEEELSAYPSCPARYVLSQLASGSMPEDRAERLFAHIEECERCQERIDTVSSRSDGLILAARRDVVRRGNDNLPQLIQKAQKLSPASPTTTNEGDTQPPARKRVDVEGFVDGLRKCGLFDEAEVVRLLSDASQDGNSTDSAQFAARLIGDGKLTTFQARALLRGRWKGLVLGNYVIMEKLAQGGMGSVFKARHRRMGRTVCLKVMNSAVRKSAHSMQRFRQEARTVAALSHPNIVVAHDADEAEGVPFIVMEYIEGKDLSCHVNEHGPLTVQQTLQAITQAAKAMEYAHAQGVVHRDIKPHNLLLSEDESGKHHVKILDMGLARFDSLLADHPDASIHAAMTNTGVIMGTVDYMSPEQAICSRDADNRSDIYSLGCTLHFLLTGKRVYDGETMMARLVAHREQPIPSITAVHDDVSANLDAVFRKMIAKQPQQRYQSMAELLTDLHAVSNGEQPNGATLTRIQRAKQLIKNTMGWVSDNKPATAALAALLLIGFMAGILMGLRPDAAERPTNVATNRTISEQVSTSQPMLVRPAGTRRDGGNGRALIIAPGAQPNGHFHQQQYTAVTRVLQDKNIDYEIASSDPGDVSAKHSFKNPATDRETDHLTTTLSLDDFDASKFDAVILISGTTWEFSNKHSKAAHVRMKKLLSESLHDGLSFMTYEETTGGDLRWFSEMGINECELKCHKDNSSILVGKPKHSTGQILVMKNDKMSFSAIQKVFPSSR